MLGKDVTIDTPLEQRIRNVTLVAFGQQKMFKRMLPAVLHFFIYAAFLMTQIELIEILADGITGKHRLFANSLGGFYTFLINFIEVLSLLALIATIVFLWRRNVSKVARFQSSEMKGWPFKDANFILIAEVLLIVGIFSMNGADQMLQNLDPVHYPSTGNLPISSLWAGIFFANASESTLVIIERAGWWLHILVVFAFINYLPFSKHLHIFFAFINTWFAPARPKGQMRNMEEISNEVKSMLGLSADNEDMPMDEEIPEFGAKDIFDLSWKNILDAYSCTECGRCTAVCPANITGKKLSPRKILMDVRDRATEVGERIRSGDPKYFEEGKVGDIKAYNDGSSLFDRISKEELHACTTCQACVEACPVLINPLEPILQMRRYEILTESAGPSDWMPMFTSIENSGSPWQVPDDRDKWAVELRNQN
jgi:heterodisulfide reductase subunit C/nitrate reductase gamma subunit